MSTFGPYTPVRQAGDFLFVSGQVGVSPTTKQAPESVTDQTIQLFSNMKQLLNELGLSLNDIVKTTVFLVDMNDFSAMNEVYEKHFSTPRPARSTVSVQELPRVGGAHELRVEIEAVAHRKQP